MRPEFTGSLPENIRAVIDELSNSLNLLDELLEYEHDAMSKPKTRP